MGLIYWIVVGLIAGWLAGKVMRAADMVCWWTSFSAFSVASSAAGCSECSALAGWRHYWLDPRRVCWRRNSGVDHAAGEKGVA